MEFSGVLGGIGTVGTTGIATGQASIDNTAGGTSLVAARAGRRYVEITNLGASDVAVGNTGLTFATGKVLRSGASLKIETTVQIFVISSVAAPQLLDYLEAF